MAVPYLKLPGIPAESENDMDGLIRSFDARRGFGFIQPLAGQPGEVADLYFHHSAVRGGLCLPRGTRVKFAVVHATGGRVQAADVRPVLARLPGLRGDGASEVAPILLEESGVCQQDA